MDKAELTELFDKYCKKLRIIPAWDVKLEFVEDPAWRKTGDFKVDCEDKKAVFLLNAVNPKQENLEEIIVHELMHLKMYPLDQVTESLITSTFEEGTPASNFAYRQFSARWSRRWRSWRSASFWNLATIESSPSVGART